MQSDVVLDYLTEVFKAQGHIKESDFDDMNIRRVNDDRKTDKDERVLHQQKDRRYWMTTVFAARNSAS